MAKSNRQRSRVRLNHRQCLSLPVFLDSADFGHNTKWLKYHRNQTQIYVRFGPRYIHREVVQCLDVATICVGELLRGRGWFAEWLVFAQKQAQKRGAGVYVECVANERLRAFLLRQGYECVMPDSLAPCYFLPCSKVL